MVPEGGKKNINDKIKFTREEEKFLSENELCRVSTSHNDIPHVAPVAYVYKYEAFFFATDYATRKYKNIKANNKVAISIDTYGSSVENKAVIIQGLGSIIEKGEAFKSLYHEFYNKFEWVRMDPWNEGEAPFVKVEAFNKVSWGL